MTITGLAELQLLNHRAWALRQEARYLLEEIREHNERAYKFNRMALVCPGVTCPHSGKEHDHVGRAEYARASIRVDVEYVGEDNDIRG